MTEHQIEHKTMNTIVHAAFRRDLARFDTALASFPAGSRQRADQLHRAWAFLVDELHHHHGYEEQYFWPALQQTDADLSVVADLDAEHDDMRRALEQATAVMRGFRADPSAQQAAAARTAVAHLGQVLLAHLAHEESDLEPISAAYKESAPMKAALTKVKKAHVKSMGNFVEWLQDGASANDKAALRRELPVPVIAVFGALAGRRYRRTIAPVWAP
jgi:hemerythrin-like domain-containing protein